MKPEEEKIIDDFITARNNARLIEKLVANRNNASIKEKQKPRIIIEDKNALYLNKVDRYFNDNDSESYYKAIYTNGLKYHVLIFPIVDDGQGFVIPSIITNPL